MSKEKIKAVSMYRYRGGVREKRLYGGQGTITEFWVYFGDEKEPMRVMGHGPTPGDRKTYAIEKAKQIRAGRLTQLRSNPAPRHERRVFTYTTAPADYDWFGSKTVSIAGHDKRGRPIRLVSSDPQHAQAQRERYMSGLHMAVDDTEWEKLVKYNLVTLQKNPTPPRLTEAGSKARVAELKRKGCKVSYAKLPNGDTAVLKKCPPGVSENPCAPCSVLSGNPAFSPNPAGGGLVTVALLAAAAVGAWLVFRKEPETKSCPTYEQLGNFGKALKYNVWYIENPVSTWSAPKAKEYLSDPKAKGYSAVECSFFKWTGSSWVADNDTNAELAAYLKPSSVSGAGLTHPFVGLTVPR